MYRWLEPSLANNLWKMQAVRLCLWMHFVAAVLVPFYRDWGGLTYTRIFTLNAWFMLWSFLLEVPTGTIADLFGRRTSIILAGVVSSVAFLVYGSVPDFRVFLLGDLLIAMAATLSSGADEALVYDSLEQLGRTEQAQKTYGRLESFKLAGIVLGALLGALIAARWGLRATMLLQSIPAAVAAFLALTLVEPSGRSTSRSLQAYVRTLRSGVSYLWRHPTLRVLTTDMVGSVTIAWLIIWLYQPQLERVGIGIGVFGVVHAAMCVAQILVLGNLDRLERVLGSKRRYLLLSALMPGLAYLGLATASQAASVVGYILVAAMFGLTRPTVFLAFMNAHIPSEQRATILSAVSMARTLSVAIVNPFAGMLADWWMNGALIVFGLAALIVALATRAGATHLAQRSTPAAS